ncbi:MAG: hypothetical protein LBJ00_07420 [Planctomycetaceae bacterium]|nr:hypothetical protein [Planctomycetaceae bacterium]
MKDFALTKFIDNKTVTQVIPLTNTLFNEPYYTVAGKAIGFAPDTASRCCVCLTLCVAGLP